MHGFFRILRIVLKNLSFQCGESDQAGEASKSRARPVLAVGADGVFGYLPSWRRLDIHVD